jgi:hypothetical protein
MHNYAVDVEKSQYITENYTQLYFHKHFKYQLND